MANERLVLLSILSIENEIGFSTEFYREKSVDLQSFLYYLFLLIVYIYIYMYLYIHSDTSHITKV